MELDPNFNHPCYKTVLVRTQWLSTTKIQLMATEERTGKNDLPSPALPPLLMNIWVIQRQWYFFSYAKRLAAVSGEDGSLCSLHTVLYLQNTQTFPCLQPCPNLPLHHTHRNRGVCLNPENRGLNFLTPLNNMRPLQKCRHDLRLTAQKGNAMNTRISNCNTSPPAPEKQWTWTSDCLLHPPLWLRPQSSSSQSCWSEPLVQWRTHSSSATV